MDSSTAAPSSARDDREGLSPPPQPDLWEDDDDDDMEYVPASEPSEDTSQTENDEGEESDYTGRMRSLINGGKRSLTLSRRPGQSERCRD